MTFSECLIFQLQFGCALEGRAKDSIPEKDYLRKWFSSFIYSKKYMAKWWLCGCISTFS